MIYEIVSLNFCETETLKNKQTKKQTQWNMSPVRSAALKNAISEAVWGMVIADAVAMPVHWFYQIEEIKKRYNGWIQGRFV